MAIVHVSTADQFWSAIGTSTNEIILDNDIDCNSITISSSKSWLASSFDGQGHTIFNLSLSSSATGMFTFGSTGSHNVTIKNVIFANVLQPFEPTSSNSYLPMFLNSYTNSTASFENIQIQGLLRGCLFGGRNMTVSRSAFKTTGHKVITNGYSTTQEVTMSQCYFDCSTIASSIIHFQRTNLTDCFIKGDFDATDYTTNYIYFSGGDLVRVVVNNKFINTNGITFNLISSTGTTCEDVLYNTTLMGTMSYNPVTGATGLTDTELKDPASVLATGFPLVT